MQQRHPTEYFHIILKGGVGYELRPEPGYKLQLRFIATQPDSKGKTAKATLSAKTSDGQPQSLLCTLKGGTDNNCKFDKNLCFYNNIELHLSKGEAIVFCSWVLYDQQMLWDSYTESDSDEYVIPEPGSKKCLWQSPSSGFQQSPSSVSTEAPELESIFDDDAPDITPPRVFSLVASSSPERSNSRSSEDRGGYFVRVPVSPAQQPPPLSIVRSTTGSASDSNNTSAVSIVSALCVVATEAIKCRQSRISQLRQREASKRNFESESGDCVIPTGAVIPQGVLKRKSRLKRPKVASPSPHLSPAMKPKKNVNWNPRSPDVRFISPPLSAIHKAFSGGLLDIGIPMLSAMPSVSSSSLDMSKTPKMSSPLSALSDSDNDFATSQPPRRAPHRPHLQPKITPPHLRPTVIE
eukprot:TRINITY_DN6352_c0_g1_i1.p1 TRINITY_DN6352_c0_g1~~TRINITY_DN6352_c0_g1_i1.p1  ORF type:complete len:408 (+),score=57.32 TRINITY_DN6352_c0_g1_i1:131-1354(+)